jgi:hypothetical protein
MWKTPQPSARFLSGLLLRNLLTLCYKIAQLAIYCQLNT